VPSKRRRQRYVHDSKVIADICDEQDEVIYADSAYVGEKLELELKEKCGEDVVLKISEKGYKNRPLTDNQKESNREKSRIRSRVEHVFGYMTMSMGGIFIRSIGMKRAKAGIARRNLAYNMKRFAFLAGRPSPA